MRKWPIILGILFVSLSARLGAIEDYKLGVGDVISVKVMYNDPLTGSYTVSPDGNIAFPLLGNLTVKDLTLEQTKTLLAERLQKGYVNYPVVTVGLEQSKSRKFYIYGEVKTPGDYFIANEVMTVLKAITIAGGLTKNGSESKVRILRPKSAGGYDVILIDLKAVIASGNGDEKVQPNDVIIVKEGWL